jgi:hypothetical protein
MEELAERVFCDRQRVVNEVLRVTKITLACDVSHPICALVDPG